MYISKSFIPILKNNPSEAKIKSHQLMLRVGMIKQSSAGIYSWLPLGFKVMKKIEKIVREEQNRIGVQEILMPTIQSSEIWKESGRYEDYGEEMLRIKDRQDREMLYGPTNEELVTDIFRSSIKSYKSLPQLLYHIQWKFRDEIRPRFGVMRSREFIMKDAYSFDIDPSGMEKSYEIMKQAYISIFNDIGLEYRIVKADAGNIGGDVSEEFHILADSGEDLLAISDSSEFAANVEVLEYDKDPTELDGKPSPDGKGKLSVKRGIEVGHIFQLGTKYSEKMNVKIKDAEGKEKTLFMGCYGIGVSRIVAASIEQNHDDKGIIWPYPIAPFHINIICLDPKRDEILKECKNVYEILSKAGHDVLLDDRDIRAGVKFGEHEMLGIPFSIVIGPNNFNNSKYEFSSRTEETKTELSIDEIKHILEELK